MRRLRGLTLALPALWLAALPARAADRDAAELARFVAAVSPKPEDEALYKSLPEEVSAQIIEQDGYDDYEHEAQNERILGGVRLDGKVTSDAQDEALIADDHGVLLPPGGAIKRLDAGTKKEQWDFPIGTRFVHRFFWLTKPQKLYELRLSEKLADGRWAYGVYAPDGRGKARLLKRAETIDETLDLDGAPHKVELRRIALDSCRFCHHMDTDNYYPSEAKAGPCGFGPAQRKKLAGWERAFKAKRGYEPFLN